MVVMVGEMSELVGIATLILSFPTNIIMPLHQYCINLIKQGRFMLPKARKIVTSYPKWTTLTTLGLFTTLAGCSITPSPLTKSDIQARVSNDLTKITAEQAQVASLDINGAIARALKHNRERKLQTLEGVLAQGQLNLNNFDMLPQLAASAGYSERNNYAASASAQFINGNPGDPSNNYSISQDKTRVNNSVAFTWNVLDFGLSYYRAKQQADRFLIAKERERKVVHNIIQDVRNSYYRAVSAERLLGKIEPLISSAQLALNDSAKIEQLRAKSPMDALSYQRELLEIQRTLQSLRSDLMTAKTELSTLMGLKPGQNFTLADVANPNFITPAIALDIETMEKTALEKRPELIESQYNRRISVEETKAALVSLLPGISLNAGSYYDDTRYLKNNDWTGVGASVSWNLFNVFKAGDITDVADMKKNLAEEQALATSMAVLSQVHIANIKFAEAKRSYDLSDKYFSVASRITEQVKNANAAQRAGQLDMIRENLNLVLAELRRDVAYADMQNSYGRVFASMGLDPVAEGFKHQTMEELAQSIGAVFSQWQAGKIDQVSQEK
jgi:outer membrane protein TolC